MFAIFSAIVCVIEVPIADQSPGLEAVVRPFVAEHKGKVALAIKHLQTGESLILDGDTVMPTASLIKVAIMAEAYQQIADGKLKSDAKLTLTKDDKVPGAGVLTEHFSDGATFTLRDAIRLMIVLSDNTATNMVLDQVGIKNVNDRMARWGYAETRINAKVYKGSTTSVDPDRTKKYGLGSTTARETLALVEQLHHGKVVSSDASKEMLEFMKKCDDTDKFPRFLPGVVIAHKTGSVSDARTAVGIMYLKHGPVAMCVLSAQNEDKSWKVDNSGNRLCADIAKSVHDYFKYKVNR